jgi:hypothetical protein
MRELRRDCLHLFMLLQCFCIKPHKSRLTHVRQERGFILLRNVLLVCVVFSMTAKLMGIVALFSCAQKSRQISSFSLPFSGRALVVGVPFLVWMSPIFRLLSENSFLDFFFPGSFPLNLRLLFSPETAVPEMTAPETAASF